jgi:hypothetical protein
MEMDYGMEMGMNDYGHEGGKLQKIYNFFENVFLIFLWILNRNDGPIWNGNGIRSRT